MYKYFMAFLMSLFLISFSEHSSAEILISGNQAGDLINAESIANADLSINIIKKGKFATDKETIKTLYVNKSDIFRFLNGSVAKDGNDTTYSQWRGGKYVTIVFDFKKTFPVSKIQIWSLCNPTVYTDGFEVLISSNNVDYVSRGYFRNRNRRDSNSFVRQDAILDDVSLARYVKLRIRRSDNSYQQQIGEIAIWALDNKEKGIMQTIGHDKVSFVTKLAGTGAVLLDWSKFASVDRGIVLWKIYKSNKPFTDINGQNIQFIKSVDSKKQKTLIQGLEPQTEYFWGVTALYKDTGEYKKVSPVHFQTPAPLECKTFSDMLAVNHFPNGGGSHQPRENEEHWQMVALDMLARTPFKETRWWTHSPKWVTEFYNRGIGFLDWAREDAQYTREANKLGIYAFSAGNEPDFSGKPLEDYLTHLKKSYNAIKGVDKRNIVTAPTVGIDRSSLAWLDRFYAAGGKDYFDVLDIHTYCKISGGLEVPAGVPAGAPEALFDGMKKVHKIMKKYDDEHKPIISTELGWATTSHGNPAGKITKQMQAQYLARGLILSYVLGFDRVYWYSFFDEGDNEYNQEHHFGLVDYYMQAKPAYYSLITLGKQLKDAVLLGEIKGVSNPTYGYTFKVKDGYVSTIWNAKENVVGTFKSDNLRLVITSLTGEQHNVESIDGVFNAKFGPSLIYIKSGKPVELLMSKVLDNQQLQQDENDKLIINIPHKTFIVGKNFDRYIELSINNPLAEQVEVRIRLLNDAGTVVSEQEEELTARHKSDFKIPIVTNNHGPSIDNYKLRISYQTSMNSYSIDEKIWVRQLTDVDKGQLKSSEMYALGSNKKLIVLANENIELTIVPELGGRIIEIIDRVTESNQLHIDYSCIDNLAAFSFKYGYWDIVQTSDGNKYFKNTPYDYEIKSRDNIIELIMMAENEMLSVVKKYSLSQDSSIISLSVDIQNKSDRTISARYYAHPEYTIGGTADHNNDVFILPGNKELIRLPVWLGLGDRPHSKIDKGWWAIQDVNMKMAFLQKFDINEITGIRIWFGSNSYNAEFNGKFLEYEPGEKHKITTEFEIKHNIKREWKGLKKY